MLDFSGGGFDGANFTFTVVKASGGDGFANVGILKISGRLLAIGFKPQPVGQTGDFGVDVLSY